MKHLLAAAFLFVLNVSLFFGQGSVRGFIKDADTGEPVIFITVGLEGTDIGTSTDADGYFSLTKVPAGTYTLLIKNIEYEEVKEAVVLENGKVLTKNLFLKKSVIELGPVEISAEKSDQKNNVNISVQSIRPQDIKKVPAFGGQADIVQVLTTLPGFISTGDQGGQIFVRGGSPVQNKVLLDGMIVYNPFHSIGLFSVFDNDIISNADVFTSGFGAQFGGRISSVMDITTRDGNKKEISGKIGASPFGGKVLVEGPLKKMKANGGGISFILSAKNSYLDKSSPKVYPWVNDGNGLPFNYTDLYSKISFGGSSGSKFNIFGFSFDDAVTNYFALADLNWKNRGAGGNFVVSPSSSPVLISGNFAWSDYKTVLKEAHVQDRSSGIRSFNFGLEFKYVNKRDVINYGVEVVGFSTEFNTFNPLGVKIELEQNTTELDGFFLYKINRDRFVLEPGLRMQYYSSFSVFSPEPRLGFKYKANRRFRLKAATGIYSQNLMATNSDRDVVNLFYGFLASPEELQSNFTTPNHETRTINNPLQKAIHYVAGFEFDITELINMNVEGYYRDFRQVTNTNRNKIFPDNADNQFRPELLRKDFIIESGRAMGVDIVLKYESKNTSINMVYSIANVDRWDGLRYYDPVFDRRHNVNFVASQKFGKKRDWDISARWNLGSGLPFTQTQGYYQPPGVEGGISTDYTISNSPVMGIQYAALNEGRLPYYHRLDVNLRKTIKREKISVEFNAGITNLYNRANVFYIDRVTAKRVDQLPALPAIGIEIGF
ncbi:MAG: TonB-dependent receptor [Crocinitomicaceae bacterium]|nr:TonB-dependent receptor [Crocinitomicaceae bacterium]